LHASGHPSGFQAACAATEDCRATDGNASYSLIAKEKTARLPEAHFAPQGNLSNRYSTDPINRADPPEALLIHPAGTEPVLPCRTSAVPVHFDRTIDP